MRSLRDGTWLVMQSLVYPGHSMRMCVLFPGSVSPHGQAVGSFGENLALYFPMGAQSDLFVTSAFFLSCTLGRLALVCQC